MGVISTAKEFGSRPSEIAGIADSYTAFCFDEACAYIAGKIRDGETPTYEVKYSSFADIYKSYEA